MKKWGGLLIIIAAAIKPNYYPQKGRLFEPYALRTDSGDIRTLQIAGPDFDYTRDGFYRDVMEKRDQAQSRCFRHASALTTITTYSKL